MHGRSRVMRGRSRMAIDPHSRMANAGTEHGGFDGRRGVHSSWRDASPYLV